MVTRKKTVEVEEPKEEVPADPPTEAITIDIAADAPATGEVSVETVLPQDAEKTALLERLRESEAAEKAAKEQAASFQRQQAEAMAQLAEAQRQQLQYSADAEQAGYDSLLSQIGQSQADAEAAQRDYEAALLNTDPKAAGDAQRRLARSEARLERLEDAKVQFEARKEQQKRAPAPPVDQFEAQISQMPENVKTWLRGNRDYVTDPRKNAKIQALHWEVLDEGHSFGSTGYIDSMEKKLGLREPPKTEDRKVVSAPVTREAVSVESGKVLSTTKVTLSPQQREIARASMPHLTPTEAEKLYAQGLVRLQKMKADGHYNQQ